MQASSAGLRLRRGSSLVLVAAMQSRLNSSCRGICTMAPPLPKHHICASILLSPSLSSYQNDDRTPHMRFTIPCHFLATCTDRIPNVRLKSPCLTLPGLACLSIRRATRLINTPSSVLHNIASVCTGNDRCKCRQSYLHVLTGLSLNLD